MKTYFIKSMIIGIVLFFSIPAKSEVTLNLNFGLPAWGPAGHEHVRYYYLPDVEAYYDTRWGMFVYYDNGMWIHRSQLPAIYINYNLFNGYKVVMNGHRGYMPYGNFKSYKVKYAKGYNPGRQSPMGNHPGKGNPHYKNPGKSMNNHKGNGNSKGSSFKKDNHPKSNGPSTKQKTQGNSNGSSTKQKNQGNSNGSSTKQKSHEGSKGNGQKDSPSHNGSKGNNGGGKGKK